MCSCFLCFQSYLFLLLHLVCVRQDLSFPPSPDAAAVAPPAAAAVVVSPSLLAAVAGFEDALVDLLPERAHVVVVVGGKLGHQPKGEVREGKREGGWSKWKRFTIFYVKF